jgi:pheromone a factor receptor
MVISATEILGTVPLGTVWIVKTAKLGVSPWRGWAYTHENYSAVYQFPASVWKNDSYSVFALEMFRWSLVLCAFLFFALFGFAEEARQHYRRVYTTIASRIGYSTSILHRQSQAYVQLLIHLRESVCLIVTHISFLGSTSSIPHAKSKGGVTVTVVTTGPHGRVSRSLTNKRNSILIANDLKPDFSVAQYSHSDFVESPSGESFDEPKMHDQFALPTAPPASVSPHFPDKTNSTLREYSFFEPV